MNIIDTLGLVFRVDSSQLTAAQNSLRSFGDTLSSIGKSLTVSLTAPIGALTTFGVKYNASMEAMQTNFEVMLGSADKAKKMTQDLVKMGAETPFDSKQLAGYTQMLLQYGYTEQNVLPIMSRLGDVSLGNSEKMFALSRAMGQINSLGRLQGQDLNQLTQQGFNPLNYIMERTGETMEQVQGRMRKNKVSYKEVEQALVDATSKGGTFYEGMEKGSKTFNGLLSTLKDNFNILAGTVTQPIFDAIKEALPKITIFTQGLAEKFNNLSPAAKNAILAIAGIAAALGPVLLIAGTVISIAAVIGPALSGGVAAIGAALGPAIAIIAGIAVVIYGIATNWDKVVKLLKSTVIPVFNSFKNNIIAPLFDKVKEWLPLITNIFGQIIDFIQTVLVPIWMTVWNFIMDYITPIWNNILDSVTFALDLISGIFTTVMAVIHGDWEKAWNGIKSVLASAVKILLSGLASFANMAIGTFNNVLKAINIVLEKLGKTKINLLDTFKVDGKAIDDFFGVIEDKQDEQKKREEKRKSDKKLESKEDGLGLGLGGGTGTGTGIDKGTDSVKKLSEALKELKDSLIDATKKFFDFGSAFELNTYDRYSPQRLAAIAKRNLKIMQDFASDLRKLEKQGAPTELINALREGGVKNVGIMEALIKANPTDRKNIYSTLMGSYNIAQEQGGMIVKHEYEVKGTIKVKDDAGKVATLDVSKEIAREINANKSRYATNPSPISSLY